MFICGCLYFFSDNTAMGCVTYGWQRRRFHQRNDWVSLALLMSRNPLINPSLMFFYFKNTATSNFIVMLLTPSKKTIVLLVVV